MKKFLKSLLSQPMQSEMATVNKASDVKTFTQPFYHEITQARLKHLETIPLLLDGKRVIDLGCGTGQLAQFFRDRGAEIFCVDGRSENIEELRRNLPTCQAAVVDLEEESLASFGKFDVVFCYGLLYHLADPLGLLKRASEVCGETMLIETCISDFDDIILRMVSESQQDVTQAISGYGCRPSSSYVVMCLRLCGFKFIYSPRELPHHCEFQYRRINDGSYLKDNHLIRDIFIASRHEIHDASLKRHD